MVISLSQTDCMYIIISPSSRVYNPSNGGISHSFFLLSELLVFKKSTHPFEISINLFFIILKYFSEYFEDIISNVSNCLA